LSIPVYYLITDLDWGGAEKNLVALATHLPAPFEPHVGCLFHAAQAAEPLREAGIPVECFEIGRPRDALRLLRLVRRLRAGRFRLMHSFLFHANLIGRVAAGLAGTPHVISSVRVAETRRWHLWLDGMTQWLVDRELCVGERLCRYTARHARVSPTRLRSIANAIDPALLPEPPTRSGRGACRILGVGRYSEQKRWTDLVDALALLSDQDWQARIVGVGDRDGLTAHVRACGLSDRIELLGPQYPLDEQYQWADLFALSSIWEGMPNVVLEAMAWALPVVATDVGAVDELVLPGLTGQLAPPRAVDKLAAALGPLIADPDARKRMGAAGRSRVQTCFSLDRMVGETVALYRELLGAV